MLPVSNLNLTASIADVVLQYPATKLCHALAFANILPVSEIKCFTKVVLLGLNKNKFPHPELSSVA